MAALFEETIFFVVSSTTEIIKFVHLVVLLPSKQLYRKFTVIISVTDLLRWRSSGPPTQLIVFTNSAKIKPFTRLNSRYSVYS